MAIIYLQCGFRIHFDAHSPGICLYLTCQAQPPVPPRPSVPVMMLQAAARSNKKRSEATEAHNAAAAPLLPCTIYPFTVFRSTLASLSWWLAVMRQS